MIGVSAVTPTRLPHNAHVATNISGRADLCAAAYNRLDDIPFLGVLIKVASARNRASRIPRLFEMDKPVPKDTNAGNLPRTCEKRPPLSTLCPAAYVHRLLPSANNS